MNSSVWMKTTCRTASKASVRAVLPYTWLRSVYPVHTRGCQGVVIEYRRPETDRGPDRLILKDLYRLDLRGPGFRYVNPHDLIADAIKARCREGVYPALPSATSSASPMA